MTEYIDRAEVIKYIEKKLDKLTDVPEMGARIAAMESAYNSTLNYIMQVPAADVEPVKRGYWIVRTKPKTPLSQAYIRIEKTFECSCCGAVHRRRMNYCGECGAKMDGKEV